MKIALLALVVANVIVLVKNFKEYVRYKKLADRLERIQK